MAVEAYNAISASWPGKGATCARRPGYPRLAGVTDVDARDIKREDALSPGHDESFGLQDN